jgi:ATP-dependent Clp protease adaptor protein ClpS
MVSFFSLLTGRRSPGSSTLSAVEDARGHAQKAGRAVVTDVDLLLAILPDDAVLGVLRACGVDVLALGEAAQAFLVTSVPRVPADKAGRSRPRPDGAHQVVASVASTLGARKDTQPIHVLRAMLMFPYHPAFSFLSERGVSLVKVLCVLAHGKADPERAAAAAPPGEFAQVVIHNDDFTPMDLVVNALETLAHLPPDKAHALMLAVHQEGRASLGAMFPGDAVRTAQLINTFARRHAAPLLATVEAPD